ncbi:hypothetical protein D3C87_81870 [compost metagenome]
MDEKFTIKDKRITHWDSEIKGGSTVSKAELIEVFGKKVYDEIQQFGFYIIK